MNSSRREKITLCIQYCLLPIIVTLFLLVFELYDAQKITINDKLGSTLAAFGLGSMFSLLWSSWARRFSVAQVTTKSSKGTGGLATALPEGMASKRVGSLEFHVLLLLNWIGIVFWVATFLLTGRGYDWAVSLVGFAYFVIAGLTYVTFRFSFTDSDRQTSNARELLALPPNTPELAEHKTQQVEP